MMCLRRRYSSVEEEYVLVNYTLSHLLKLTLSMLSAGISIIAAAWNMICEDTKVLSLIFSYIGTAVSWSIASYILRKEYLTTGQTSLYLRIWWVIALAFHTALVTILSTVEVGIEAYDNVTSEFLLLLILYGALVVVGFLKSNDEPSSVSLNSYYHAMLASPLKEDEDIWDEMNKINEYEKEEEQAKLLRRKQMMHMINAITVDSHRLEEEEEGPVVYYLIKVYKNNGRVVEHTRRRYSEFLALSEELALEDMPFPPKKSDKGQVTLEVIKSRSLAFDSFLKYAVLQNQDRLNDFLKPIAEVPKYGRKKSEDYIRPSSVPASKPPTKPTPKPVEKSIPTESIDKNSPQVNIINSYESGSGYSKFTMYEIQVNFEGRVAECAHRFKDFKKLNEAVLKRYGTAPEFPASGFYFSSTDAKVVNDRKTKLETFLQELLINEETRHDPDVIEFLSL